MKPPWERGKCTGETSLWAMGQQWKASRVTQEGGTSSWMSLRLHVPALKPTLNMYQYYLGKPIFIMMVIKTLRHS